MSTQASAIRRYFDAASEEYARSRAQEYSFIAQKRIALEFLPPRLERVLDIGCGPAVLAADLLERAGEYCGIDLSPQMIALGRSRMAAAACGSRCTLSVGDAEALAFADGSFDAIVALGLLEYLPSYASALREICRVLRPGGVAVLAVPNRLSAYRRCRRLADRARGALKRLLGQTPRASERFVWNPCVPARLDEELRRAGFAVAAGRYCNFILYPLHDLHPRASLAVNRALSGIAPLALTPWLGAQYVVKALKA
ncbi:MAG TPA: class I SAM-dependent methyltransferase [Burkholderiales bacterium]|nr:class I SAM-dependent methyltransferase [Burkholderiales bacterium]